MAADRRLPAPMLSAAGYPKGSVPRATGAGGFKPGILGAGVLGSQQLLISYPTMTCNGGVTHASSISNNGSQLDPDLSIGSTSVVYCASGVDCAYVEHAAVLVNPGAGVGAADVAVVGITMPWLAMGGVPVIGSANQSGAIPGGNMIFTSPSTVNANPNFEAQVVGTGTGVYDVTVILYILRLSV